MCLYIATFLPAPLHGTAKFHYIISIVNSTVESVNRTLYIVSMRSAISALATCNITPSNVQYHQILHSVCTAAPIENIDVVRLYKK